MRCTKGGRFLKKAVYPKQDKFQVSFIKKSYLYISYKLIKLQIFYGYVTQF